MAELVVNSSFIPNTLTIHTEVAAGASIMEAMFADTPLHVTDEVCISVSLALLILHTLRKVEVD